MLSVRLLVGRLIPTSEAVTGGSFEELLLIRTYPKRKSLTSVGENRWVSETLKKRSLTGNLNGKFRSVPLILPPNEACRPPAPKGTFCSELEKKNRAEILSCELRNSRSQFAVNWSSVNLPGLLIANCPVEPAAPGAVGKR